jgi:hypothetical protein
MTLPSKSVWGEFGLTDTPLYPSNIHPPDRRISSDLQPGYEPRPDDISMAVSTQDNRSGNVVIREVMTTRMLLSELLSYGNNCYLISPSVVRRRSIAEVEKILSSYSTSAK